MRNSNKKLLVMGVLVSLGLMFTSLRKMSKFVSPKTSKNSSSSQSFLRQKVENPSNEIQLSPATFQEKLSSFTGTFNKVENPSSEIQFVSPAMFKEKVRYYTDYFSTDTTVSNSIKSAYPGSKRVNSLYPMDWNVACCANAHMGKKTHDFKFEDPSNFLNVHPSVLESEDVKVLPCEGIKDSIANKRELCRLSREFPNVVFTPKCQVLSSENSTETALQWLMKDSDKLWVLKDSDLGKHRGNGVLIDSANTIAELVKEGKFGTGSVLQQYITPAIFPKLRRKVEFRQYLITTSLQPLRLYAGSIWLSHSPSPYNSSYEMRYNRCIHLNHAQRLPGETCDKGTMTANEQQPSLENWAKNEGIDESMVRQIRDNIDATTTALFLAASKDIDNNPYFKRFRASKHRCFFYTRADLALEADTLKAYVVELNEYPYQNHAVRDIRRIQEKDSKSMFKLLGVLDPKEAKELTAEQATAVRQVCEANSCTLEEIQELGRLLWESNNNEVLRLLHPRIGTVEERAQFFEGLPNQKRYLKLYEELLTLVGPFAEV